MMLDPVVYRVFHMHLAMLGRYYEMNCKLNKSYVGGCDNKGLGTAKKSSRDEGWLSLGLRTFVNLKYLVFRSF